MTPDGNAAIYTAALDRANAGDLGGYLDLYSDDDDPHDARRRVRRALVDAVPPPGA
jgi:hypothetical protein